jgi:hypothetical protein
MPKKAVACGRRWLEDTEMTRLLHGRWSSADATDGHKMATAFQRNRIRPRSRCAI